VVAPSQYSEVRQFPSLRQQTAGGPAVQGLATSKKVTVPGGVSSHSREDVVPTSLPGSATADGTADR